MKGSTRKRLIPSLAASIVVAAATFAPLPSFLTSGNAYADAKLPIGTIVKVVSKDASKVTDSTASKTSDKSLTGTVTKVVDKSPVTEKIVKDVAEGAASNVLSSAADKALDKASSSPTSTYPLADIRINSRASVLPTTVDITGQYRCSVDVGATAIHVTLTQQPPEVPNTTEGSNTANVVCDNQPHPVIVPITVDNNALPFNFGQAIATATLTDAQGNPIGDLQTSPITIVP